MILNYFANIVMKNNPKNVMDIVFAFECLNGGIVEREAILHYISARFGMEYKEYPNFQIYKYLSTIVRELESGKKRKVDLPDKPMRIIVD